MFVVLLTYVKPIELVDQHMKAHMAFVRNCYREKIFIVSGRVATYEIVEFRTSQHDPAFKMFAD